MLKYIAIAGVSLFAADSFRSARPGSRAILFLQLLFTLSLLPIVWSCLIYPKYFSPLRKIPCPKNQKDPQARWLKNFLTEPDIDTLLRYARETPNDGLLRYTGILGEERILLTGAEARKEVFQQRNYEFPRAVARERVGMVTGERGIIVTEGDVHKLHRKALTPAFSFRNIKNLYPLYWKKSLQLTDKLAKEVEGTQKWTSQNIHNWAMRGSFDIIGVAAFGTDFNTVDNPVAEVSQTWLSIFNHSSSNAQKVKIFQLMALIFPMYIFRHLPLARWRQIRTAVQYMRRVCAKSIHEAKYRIEKGGDTKAQSVDILSVALRSQTFVEEEMIDQLMTFLAAGHDTTASTLSWIMFNLCKHPEVQDRLRAEIEEKVSSLGDDVPEVIDDIPYLEAVCNETLRLYPTIAISYRHSLVPTTITGCTIPSRTRVVNTPWVVNRNTEAWGANAEAFDPDRWLEKSNDGKVRLGNGGANLYDFSTFNWGPRHCIGEQFARAVLRMILISLVRKFEWRMSAEDIANVKKDFGVVMKPAGGLMVELKVVDRS